jgi:hypothetical protein
MSDLEASKTPITAGGSGLYPSLTDAEIAKITRFVTEQDRERRLTVGRMRYLMSYWIRRGSDRNDHPFAKATAETARGHVSILLREISRLRDVLRDISIGSTDRCTQAEALEALCEPDLGPPDIVCRASDMDTSIPASSMAAAAMFTDEEFEAWEAMGGKTCRTCGLPLRPCPKGPGADAPGYVGFYPCKHDDEDPNG